MKHLIEILDKQGCSLVIRSQGKEQCYWKRGVADLFHLLRNEPQVLLNAQLADKVIGKGAAALMVLGGVKEVYSHIISQPALQLLEDAHVCVSYTKCVEHIINRVGTDWCPVEKLCMSATTAEECLSLIEQFLEMKQKQ